MIDLKKYVEESNAQFIAATAEEKRVMIAKDVIERINVKNLIPITGSIIKENNDILNNEEEETSFKELINSGISCDVCGKGALLCAFVGRVNQFTVGDVISDIGHNNEIDNHTHTKLLELISLEQLDLIETAFEGSSYLHILHSWDDDERAVAFYKEYEDKDRASDRLIAIMENIIENSGTFKP